MRTRLGVALLVVALALGGALAAAGSADAADSHSITVTPSTGLRDGQTVTVSGSGFIETPAVNDWAVTECDSGLLAGTITIESALAHCGVITGPSVFAHADASGQLSTPFAPQKSFTTDNGPVTCADNSDDCVILVAQVTAGGRFVGAAAPITFGAPVTSVAQCYREFAHDHRHTLRYRLSHLPTCVFSAVHSRRA